MGNKARIGITAAEFPELHYAIISPFVSINQTTNSPRWISGLAFSLTYAFTSKTLITLPHTEVPPPLLLASFSPHFINAHKPFVIPWTNSPHVLLPSLHLNLLPNLNKSNMIIRRLNLTRNTLSLTSTALRTYATISKTITLSASQIPTLDLRTLSGISSIHLSTTNTWPPRSPDLKRHEASPHEAQCIAELPPILEALHLAPGITTTCISLSDILALPIRHNPNNHPPGKVPPRTPASIFQTLGLSAKCQDVGIWTLPSYPKISIRHDPTILALRKARSFASKASWHAFVSALDSINNIDDAVYKAYDYTADFHSGDLQGKPGDNRTWTHIDLGVFGKGYWRVGRLDEFGIWRMGELDEFSTIFAEDIDDNISYFRQLPLNEWRPEMRAALLKKHDGYISSNLNDMKEGAESGMDATEGAGSGMDATSIIASCDIWELDGGMIEKLVEMLEVGEDEEIMYARNAIRKLKSRKKGE